MFIILGSWHENSFNLSSIEILWHYGVIFDSTRLYIGLLANDFKLDSYIIMLYVHAVQHAVARCYYTVDQIG